MKFIRIGDTLVNPAHISHTEIAQGAVIIRMTGDRSITVHLNEPGVSVQVQATRLLEKIEEAGL